MPSSSFWTREGNWYKGQFHTHTINSDGAASPAEIVTSYRKRGYDFLAIADHNRLTRVEKAPEGLLMISGEEITAGVAEMGGEFHFVAVNIKEAIDPKKYTSPQAIIDAVRAQGGGVIIAHPYWSALTLNDMLPLHDYFGVEVYNSSCHYSIGKGNSANQWDDLLARNIRVYGFANDDAHHHCNDHRPDDVANAYIMVKAAACTTEHIMAAVAAGEFYACSGPGDGPVIKDFFIENGYAVANTSKAKLVTIAADCGRGFGESYAAAKRGLITEATYKLRGREKYVRLEVADADGKTAWSNPVFL
ncbi:MAG: CehA/McbA family metallohydrolase [Spirochaetes bacterium]|nr:CehA/McbA family metallohydrolase [Spirochaetota bacterium]